MKKISFVLAILITLSLLTAIPFAIPVSAARTVNTAAGTGMGMVNFSGTTILGWSTYAAAYTQSCVGSGWMYNPLVWYNGSVTVNEISFTFDGTDKTRNDCALFKVYYSNSYTFSHGSTDDLTAVMTEIGVQKVTLSGTTVTFVLDKPVTGRSFMIYINSFVDGGRYTTGTITTAYDTSYASDLGEYGVDTFTGTHSTRLSFRGDYVGLYYQANAGNWRSFLPTTEIQSARQGGDRYNPVIAYNGNNMINEIVLRTSNQGHTYYDGFNTVEVYYGALPISGYRVDMSFDPRSVLTKGTVRKVIYDGVAGNYVRIILDETIEAQCFMVYLAGGSANGGGFAFGESYGVYDPANEEGYSPDKYYFVSGQPDPTAVSIVGASGAPEIVSMDNSNNAVVTQLRSDHGTRTFDKMIVPDVSGHTNFAQFQKLSFWYSDDQNADPSGWTRVGFTVTRAPSQQPGSYLGNIVFTFDQEITASYLMVYTAEVGAANNTGFKMFFTSNSYYNRVINEPDYQGITPRVGDPAVTVIAVVAVTAAGAALSLRRRSKRVKI